MNVPQQTDVASETVTAAATPRANLLRDVAEICEQQLRPSVRRIDEGGVYPERIMRNFGAAGLYSQHLTGQGNSDAIDMPLAIEAMALVGYECLSTAFCVWCHDACGWYLEKTNNADLKEKLVGDIASGAALGATGLSNPMKFYSGIESLRVSGQRVDGGYLVNGSLPWVSNLLDEHYFGVVFEDSDEANRRVMAIVRGDHPGVKLCDGGRFIALEGSATFAVRFKDCLIPDELILADPADAYIASIRPGFVLMQVGMGIGVVRACVSLMRKQDKTLHHVNQFLPRSADDLQSEAEDLLQRTKKLAETPHETNREFMIDALQARLEAGELCLAASQACMLNGGARAYMEGSLHFRKLREAYFVGVVTPAIKHLRKEICRLKAIANQ